MPVRVQQKLLEYFVAGATARTAARLAGVQGRTAVVFFQRLRQLIASKQESFLLSSKFDVDDSYWGRGRKGQRGGGPPGHTVVFGLLMRNNKIRTMIIAEADTKAIIPIIRENVTPDSIVYMNMLQAADVLDISEFRYKCINPCKTVLSRRGYHVNGVENFWNESRRYLRRFNGIRKNSFYWFLKECEWRFNESNHHALSHQLSCWYQSRLTKR